MPVLMGMRFFNHRVLHSPRHVSVFMLFFFPLFFFIQNLSPNTPLFDILDQSTTRSNSGGPMSGSLSTALVALDLIDEIEQLTGFHPLAILSNLYDHLERINELRTIRYAPAQISMEEYNRPYYYGGDLTPIWDLLYKIQDLLDRTA